jgi:hypothetical protein
MDFDADGPPTPRRGTARLTDGRRDFAPAAALAVLGLST